MVEAFGLYMGMRSKFSLEGVEVRPLLYDFPCKNLNISE